VNRTAHPNISGTCGIQTAIGYATGHRNNHTHGHTDTTNSRRQIQNFQIPKDVTSALPGPHALNRAKRSAPRPDPENQRKSKECRIREPLLQAISLVEANPNPILHSLVEARLRVSLQGWEREKRRKGDEEERLFSVALLSRADGREGGGAKETGGGGKLSGSLGAERPTEGLASGRGSAGRAQIEVGCVSACACRCVSRARLDHASAHSAVPIASSERES